MAAWNGVSPFGLKCLALRAVGLIQFMQLSFCERFDACRNGGKALRLCMIPVPNQLGPTVEVDAASAAQAVSGIEPCGVDECHESGDDGVPKPQ